MNRTLKRPMLRIGGSAGTGITSGLTMPRASYSEGTRLDKIKKIVTEDQAIMDELAPSRQSPLAPGTLSSFLIGTGLNLASATPRGKGFSGIRQGLGFGKGGAGMKTLGRFGKGLGGGMLASAGIAGAATAETGVGKGLGVLAGAGGGALLGAQLGSMFGPGGTLVGGIAGGLIGGGTALMSAMGKKERQIGTLNATGKAFEPQTANMLVHKNERVLNPDEAKTVNQLEQGLNFKPLIESMTALNTKIITANNTLTSMSNSVNTLVGINNEELKVAKRTMSDTTARGVLLT